MAINIRAELLHYQHDFIQSTAFYDMLFGGYGSGKTYVLVHKLLQLAAKNYGMPGGILVPTIKMFKRDVLPTFTEICAQANMKMKYVKGDGYIWIPALRAQIWVFHSEDDGESIRGPNLAYGGVNEITLCSEKAFKAFLARVRLKNAALRQIAGSGTPEGFNWTYEMFVAEPRKDASIFYGDMRQNHFVAAEYAQILMDSYDTIMQEQFVGGQFRNTTHGSALHKFNRQKHVVDNIKYEPGLPVWVSLDFNVSPFAATLWNRYPDKEHVKLRGFDEISIIGGDTWQMCDAIKEKCPDAKEIIIFPDPAGNARKTSAKENITDIDILEGAFGSDNIRYNTSVTVRECLLAANRFTGKNHMIIDRKKCKEAIKDFEQCILKPGTSTLEKKNLRRTHWLDGYKNMIEHEWPIVVEGGDSWRSFRVR